MTELKNQVAFLLSVKYQAQQSLVSQLTEFKTNVLSSNLQDKDASIAVIIDEIWNCYDSGELNKDEMRKLVKDFMPELKRDFEFSEYAFE